jgi:hypothetical protein
MMVKKNVAMDKKDHTNSNEPGGIKVIPVQYENIDQMQLL